ncbi:MAG: hypothetical protein KF746_13665 [Chitinophagaceae bacterium]|nr:hypothetical protein [Chitinophagaceae bacterium]
MGRITFNPNGAFITQTNFKGNFRNEEDTIDLCRCMINPNYRGRNIFNILILSGLAYSFKLGKKYVNGAVVQESLVKKCRESLHFDTNYERALIVDPHGNIVSVCPMRCDLQQEINGVKEDLIKYTSMSTPSGFSINSKQLYDLVF